MNYDLKKQPYVFVPNSSHADVFSSLSLVGRQQVSDTIFNFLCGGANKVETCQAPDESNWKKIKRLEQSLNKKVFVARWSWVCECVCATDKQTLEHTHTHTFLFWWWRKRACLLCISRVPRFFRHGGNDWGEEKKTKRWAKRKERLVKELVS